MKLKYLLPRLYENLFPEELLQFSIEEKRATCDFCAMAPGRSEGKIVYREDLKCCTFYPFMPNFLIGASFKEAQANPDLGKDLREDLQAMIRQRKYSLPIGFLAPVRYQLEFNQRKPQEFGQREDWLCPYFDSKNKNCRIWRTRSAVCSTFYCKSSYGKAGLSFWHELSEYLTYVEMAMLEEALIRLDFSPRQISNQLDFLNRSSGTQAEARSWVIPEKKARLLWNGYFDEQELFFRKTLEIVTNFDRRDFHEALGELGEKIFDRLMKQARKVSHVDRGSQ